jgi:hypothetical protein
MMIPIPPSSDMTRVVIESPYAGDIKRNLRYLRAAMRDCLKRGESPYASHALYPQPGVLCDEDAGERDWGIQAGFAWRHAAEKTVVYTDLGTSTGMEYGIADAEKYDRPIEFRLLGPEWEAQAEEDEKTRPGLGWV